MIRGLVHELGLPPEKAVEALRELVPDPPEGLARRFGQLKALLRHQPEFAARFPEAHEIRFPGHAKKNGRGGLSLRSFGIRILPSAPGAEWVSQEDKLFGGDAFSYTGTQPVLPTAIAAIQGILLAILSREEYTERIQPSPLADPTRSDLFEGVRVPEEPPIRITDLRLASVLKPGVLKRSLIPLLDRLERPITAEGVASWKLHLLGEALEGVDTTARAERKPIWAQTALLRERLGDEGTGIAAVSFAAAALWLFLDLGMPGVEDAASYLLAENIESLASIVREQRDRLLRGAKKLETLLARRAAGGQRYPRRDYLALLDYRMGEPLEEIAEKLGIAACNSEDEREGIIPYDWDSEWPGMTPEQRKDVWQKLEADEKQKRRKNRNWKAQLKKHLIDGKKFEDEHYPRAAAIFANKDNPHVRKKALLAYREYGDKGFINRHALCHDIRVGRAGTARGREIADAYLLLGESIEQDRTKLP